MSTPEHNPLSAYFRIGFKEGVSREQFYQLGQRVARASAWVYAINDSSCMVGPEGHRRFERSFTIELINKDGEVYDFYTYIMGTNDSVSLQANGEFINV